MADLNFYFSNREKLELFEQLYSEGCKIVPDLDYKYPEYPTLIDLDECLKFIDINHSNLLFIIHSTFSVYPLCLEPVKKSDQIKYYIRQRYGGPSLSLFFTGLFKRDNLPFIGHGFLSYYPYYYHPTNNDKLIVPEEVKSLFKKISKWINKNTVPYKLHSRTYHLGKDAIKQALENNYQLRDIDTISLIELREKYKF